MRLVSVTSVRLLFGALAAVALCRPASAIDLFAPAPRAASPRMAALAIPAGTPCTGLSNTTGDPYIANPAGSSGIYVQRFEPGTIPFNPTAVCVAGFSGLPTPEPYDVVIYSDVAGVPGTLLTVVPAVPAAPGTFPGSWMRTSVSVPPVSGPFWAGLRITTGIQFNLDFETMASPAPQAISIDGGATFTLFPGNDVASVAVEGVAGAAAIPTLSGFGLLSLVAAFAVSGLLAIRRA